MALDELTYPAPVANRQGPAGSALGAVAPALASPPQSYVFPFVLDSAAGTRSTVSSPRLRGPSIIRGLHFAKGGTPEGKQGIALGKSASAVTETDVLVATPRPYTSLFRGLPAVGTTEGSPSDTTSLVDMQSTILSDADDLGIIVLDRDWFLTVTVSAAVGITTDAFHGYVTLLDGVPEETLRNFL